jgi:hypothetical protein
MPTLSPIQREAYEALQALWLVRGIKRPRAIELFKTIMGYEEVPYFMELDVEECDRIINNLRGDRLHESLSRLGRQSGVCEACGRELTDPQSIAAGIGPVCGGKVKALASIAELL